jgi:menaquinone-specific isochorismate synthase
MSRAVEQERTPGLGGPVRLRVRTRFVDALPPLVGTLPSAHGAAAWLHGTDGIVGWGETACAAPAGPDRFGQARSWWRELCERAEIDDEVGLPGSGLVAFAGFAFADQPGDSWLTVPAEVLGRSGDRCWRTTIAVAGAEPAPAPEPEPVRGPGIVRFTGATVSAEQYRAVVAAGVARIRAGHAEKIVLARDQFAEAERDVDPRYLLDRLVAANPASWTYCVGGLVGATPELLLRRRGDVVESRVLAGTSFPGHYWTGDQPGGESAAELFGSDKDRSEHRYAVRSVLERLAPHTTELHAPAEPVLLRLNTLAHLATDVRGTLRADAPDVLALVAELHPTAAVGGTPRDAALHEIAALEPMDRGRYAGPVGWIDARGDGEFGIALRCAQLTGRGLRMYAGCGVVAASDPEVEAAEAEAKFRVLRAALTGGDEEPTASATGTNGHDGRDTAMPATDTSTESSTTSGATGADDFPHLRADLERVRALIGGQLAVADSRIHEPCGRLIRNSGRLFRPTLALTSAYPFAPDGPAPDGVIRAAAIMELLHVATLYHDDLCDDATARRGERTVNAEYGTTIALLCGDYLLATCTRLLSTMGPDAMLLFGETLKDLCSGQFLETVDLGDLGRTEAAYFESIAGKTAKLMSSSAAFGAMQAGATPEQQKIMAGYGHHLGVAFQIWDDLLDLWSAHDTGKPRYVDLRNGVYTLPVIYGLEARPELAGLLERGELSDADCAKISALLDEAEVRDRCLAQARTHITAALSSIGELGDVAGRFLPRLVGVARDLMPEVNQLLAAVMGKGPQG